MRFEETAGAVRITGCFSCICSGFQCHPRYTSPLSRMGVRYSISTTALQSIVFRLKQNCRRWPRRHNKLHGITPSVAKAASVGDSILDSINGDAVHTQREGRDSSSDHVASWANHSLPPDQVKCGQFLTSNCTCTLGCAAFDPLAVQRRVCFVGYPLCSRGTHENEADDPSGA